MISANMIDFKLRLAQITYSVECCYPSTKRLCRDYQVDGAEISLSEIRVAPEDVEQERIRLLKEDPSDVSSMGAIESLALCRKLAEQFPEHDRVLFHCSSLAIDGEGVLFTAKSGTGKSTHTRLWREAFRDRVVMINDDKPFLHIAEDRVTVFGSPWQGKHSLGNNTSAPVKAICIVCRGEKNSIEPISAREAFPLLMQQTFYPERPDHIMATLRLVDRLTKLVPIYRLYCNMDPEAAEVAFAGIHPKEKKDGVL